MKVKGMKGREGSMGSRGNREGIDGEPPTGLAHEPSRGRALSYVVTEL
jgi:hypothetical protein